MNTDYRESYTQYWSLAEGLYEVREFFESPPHL